MKSFPSAARSLCILLAVAALLPGRAVVAAEKTFPDKIGVEIDGLGGGGRAKVFIDLAKTANRWFQENKQPVPSDERGWPKIDANVVLFDIRSPFTWSSAGDDPEKFQPDWSGTYKSCFQGQADLGTGEDPSVQIANQKYDPTSNLTTFELIVPKGIGIVVLKFKNTKRTADSPAGSGITHLRMLRPGYELSDQRIFLPEFVNSLKPFAALRFMDWLDTNHNYGFYGDPGHHALNWADRHVPEDAYQCTGGTKVGGCWEYLAELAKLTGKDVWINIPTVATDDYVKNLAKILKDKLPAKCNIYIEHSNEVWNFSFPQYVYNKLAAIDEVKQGNSNLNNDGEKKEEVWAHRRHAKRLVEIGNIFRETFGKAAATRIRPVYASWQISVKPHYAEVLDWVSKTYGEPKQFFYALAGAAYYGIGKDSTGKAPVNATPQELVQIMRLDSDRHQATRQQIQALADKYQIKHFQYEIGPDVGGGKTENVGNRILANRLPEMKEVLIHDARDNWFAHGGDLYMYFSHCSAYSRHGAWGLSEDINNLNTPKWQAIYELTGTAPPR